MCGALARKKSVRTLVDGLRGRHTGEVRATAFLKQRLDLAIQRGNAAAVVGTLSEGNVSQGLL